MPHDWNALFQPKAGILIPEECIQASLPISELVAVFTQELDSMHATLLDSALCK